MTTDRAHRQSIRLTILPAARAVLQEIADARRSSISRVVEELALDYCAKQIATVTRTKKGK